MGDDLGLSELAESALTEVLNIAASHSANAVSDRINEPVHIVSPDLDIINFETLSKTMNNSLNSAVVVCGDLLGDISGSVVLFFPLQNSSVLLKMLGANGDGCKKTSKENHRPIQEIGHTMLFSFAEAVSGFFGSDVSAGNFFSGVGKVDLILNHLKERLDNGDGNSAFVNTNFTLSSDLNVCRLFLSLTQDDLNRLFGAEIPEFSDEFESLTDMVGTFEELTNIESRLNDYIQNIDVPMEAKRRFLRSIKHEDFENDRLRGLIINLLLASKVGENITIIQNGPFEYELTIEGCKVCDIFPTEGTKSCYTTATALGRFFLETLDIGNEVEEIKCVKIGDPACVYKLKLESIDIFSIIPKINDIKILKCVVDGVGDIKEIIKRTGLSDDEGARSFLLLEFYDLLKLSGEIATLTDTGRVLVNFAQNASIEEEKDLESWDDLGLIDKKIQSSRSNEKVEVGFEEATPPWE